MLFNSLEFAIFLPIVFLLYWFVFDSLLKKCKHQLLFQNFFIVIVSYIFYGWWDWRFLVLIAFTSFCSWGSGLLIQQEKRPKLWMLLNVIVNLLILSIFKYHNFFVTSFADIFGANPEGLLLKIILPVGISFYTFQAISYSIDIYRKKLPATKDIVAFFAFVSFFPQLVAGPIERATNLLPQFQKKRTFNYEEAVDGMRRILWGLFKKVVIADNCATIANTIFGNYEEANWISLIIGALAFTFQIYGDFSGYSDIAIGTSHLFGIDIMTNFKTPYYSGSIPEFWRRWHISLNTWFRDYLYIPLGGNKKGKTRQILNIMIVFGLSGLWHGANWTYIAWGLYFGILMIPYIFKFIKENNSWYNILGTFILVVIGWIFFRSESMSQAFSIISKIATLSDGSFCTEIGVARILLTCITLFVGLILMIEFFNRENEYLFLAKGNRLVRWIKYLLVILIILIFTGNPETFIYFQF